MPPPRTTYDERLVHRIRCMAGAGHSRAVIADDLGMSVDSINRIMARFGITTHARRGVRPKPVSKVAPMRAGIGQPPAKLMPSREALGLVSVWALARV